MNKLLEKQSINTNKEDRLSGNEKQRKKEREGEKGIGRKGQKESEIKRE